MERSTPSEGGRADRVVPKKTNGEASNTASVTSARADPADTSRPSRQPEDSNVPPEDHDDQRPRWA